MDPQPDQLGVPDGSAPVARLLERMRRGDREATAEFMQRYAPLLRRRIRWKLGAGTRRIFDSEEILATLGRRLDRQIHQGALEVRSEGEFWALVRTMLEHTIVDKARQTTRAREAEIEAAHRQRELDREGEVQVASVDESIQRALHSVADEDDRELLSLWMRGVSHAESAASMNLPSATVRKRWQRLLGRLRAALGDREDES